MNQLINNLLLLSGNITVNIDFPSSTVLEFYKSNRIIATNLSYNEFLIIFCKEEHLSPNSIPKLTLFLENLNPSSDPFSTITTLEKESKDGFLSTVKYEVKGVLRNDTLLLTFSNLIYNSSDSYDSVTKVFSREVIIDNVKNKILEKNAFALIILDIDNFKQFNDLYGHMFGDIILVETVSAIKNSLQSNDLLGRIGGDEFLILINLPNNEYDEAYQACSKIKQAIQDLSYNNIKQASVTATLGCSVFPKDGEDYNTIFKKADKALYRGKKKGRNCFVIYSKERCGVIDNDSEYFNHDIESFNNNSQNYQVIIALYEILTRNSSVKKNLYAGLTLLGNFFLIERINLFIHKLGYEEDLQLEWVEPRVKQFAGLVENKSNLRDIIPGLLDQTGMFKINQVKKTLANTPLFETLTRQRTASYLGLQLKHLDNEVGFIRFDTCTTNKFWNQTDVSALMVISRLFAITINKYNQETLLEKDLFYDPLTNLYTFSKFRDEIADRHLGECVDYSIIYFNILHFSEINTSFGTNFGDKLLVILANAIKTNAAEGQYCRVSDDRFLLYVEITDSKKLLTIYKSILANFYSNVSDQLELKIQVGIYQANKNDNLSDAVDKANAALKSLAPQSSTTYVFFNDELNKKFKAERDILNHMYKALEDNEFLLFLQPKVEIKTGKLYGAEALSRWNFEGKTMLMPNSFIPIFEKVGFINALDLYIFEEVCKFLKALKDEGLEQICISVNISRYQVSLDDYVKAIEKIRKAYGIDAKYIEIEITEGMYIERIDKVGELVESLHKLNYRVSMDDFGSGYSNLAALAQLNFDMIKLDGSIIKSEDEKCNSKPILTFIKELTNSLNINVICEGVETKMMENVLDSLGYSLGQGFLYDKPLPAIEFKNKYLKNKSAK